MFPSRSKTKFYRHLPPKLLPLSYQHAIPILPPKTRPLNLTEIEVTREDKIPSILTVRTAVSLRRTTLIQTRNLNFTTLRKMVMSPVLSWKISRGTEHRTSVHWGVATTRIPGRWLPHPGSPLVHAVMPYRSYSVR